MTDALVDRIRRAVSTELPPAQSVVAAVSGGIDSMVLLDALVATRPADAFRAATFDHGSGPHAERAVELVQRVAMSAGITVIVGRADPVGRPSEAAWRERRLSFLKAAAAEYRAILATAYTRDDQIETVLFREMRGAGARGLAGLRARGPVRRPLLGICRDEIERYARATGVEWVDDPTNESRSYARNRIRHEILPALRRESPSIDAELSEIGERAGRWRDELDATLERSIEFRADVVTPLLHVSLASLRHYETDVLAVIWPALLGRIGVAADWRGTRRLVEFTKNGSTGGRIQLSGGWVVALRRDGFEVGRSVSSA